MVFPSSGKADGENDCSSKDCGVKEGNVLLSKCNSIARGNEEHTVRDAEGKCGVSVLPVAATDRVAGNEWKGYYNTVQNAKAHATNPDDRKARS